MEYDTDNRYPTEFIANGETQEMIRLLPSQIEYVCEIIRDFSVINGGEK